MSCNVGNLNIEFFPKDGCSKSNREFTVFEKLFGVSHPEMQVWMVTFPCFLLPSVRTVVSKLAVSAGVSDHGSDLSRWPAACPVVSADFLLRMCRLGVSERCAGLSGWPAASQLCRLSASCNGSDLSCWPSARTVVSRKRGNIFAVHCAALWTATVSQVWTCVKYEPKPQRWMLRPTYHTHTTCRHLCLQTCTCARNVAWSFQLLLNWFSSASPPTPLQLLQAKTKPSLFLEPAPLMPFAQVASFHQWYCFFRQSFFFV